MDPLTHALAGATLAWVAAGDRLGRRPLLIGASAALLPDVDVLIRSASDPLLAIEHHRGFTHSLLFVPVGGIVAALPFAARLERVQWRWAALAGLVAYASHTLLDAATTYGTQWLWPFSRSRVGLDAISIIDPLFTLLLLAGLIAACLGRRRAALVALALCAAWLGAGLVQRERASAVQARLAAARGDRLARGEVFPTIGNTLVWRSIYESDGRLHIDRIRVPWLGRTTYAAVDAVPLATVASARGDARLRRDFERFAWFSGGWTARSPSDATVIGDARYSLHTGRYEPVWGIRFRPGSDPPLEWVDRTRERKPEAAQLWNEIRGRGPAALVP
ncbi:MAG TPA: metal-dependent hydrolase [Thermoanaerobaculia bacterium]|nr:metal-dependent hydrolase [Thermoanaerobaculia bacterium]